MAVFNLYAFVFYLFCSLALLYFLCRQKVPKSLAPRCSSRLFLLFVSCVATSLSRRKLVVQAYSQIFWRSGIKLCLIDNACSNRSRRARVAKSKRCQLPSLTVCANRAPHSCATYHCAYSRFCVQNSLTPKYLRAFTVSLTVPVFFGHYLC